MPARLPPTHRLPSRSDGRRCFVRIAREPLKCVRHEEREGDPQWQIGIGEREGEGGDAMRLLPSLLSGEQQRMLQRAADKFTQFEVVAVSFDPKDTPELAAAKKESYLKRYNRPGAANGWHLLTGDEANTKALMDAIGYHYKYDPATDQYAHASGVMVVTPEGRLSRYFYGIEYAPRDLRLGLVEASQNKIGNPVDQILLFCFHYDPATGKYGAVAMNIVRVAGAAFVLICGAFLAIVLRRDFKNDRKTLRRVG